MKPQKTITLRPAIDSQTIPEDYGAASRRVEDFDWKLLLMNPKPLIPLVVTPLVLSNGIIPNIPGPTLGDPVTPWQTHWHSPEVPILVSRKDGRLGKLKRNLVAQDDVDTDAEGSDEIYEEEFEITTPIHRRRMVSTSPSPFKANTTTHEMIRSPIHLNLQLNLQQGHPHLLLPPPILNYLRPRRKLLMKIPGFLNLEKPSRNADEDYL
ncbi:hypothetical protein O181_011620 [Austropuccinia psidii MF-1]|uniref:Uncharacterized protein n=1 Tax=Austropuccinia psidii MF-1 TaxID=1389203 RepID=A0A9Q3BVH5_9BASI|nr:hypothetical protein [Austropuccinia psidii MF-1]